jgi:putative transposase
MGAANAVSDCGGRTPHEVSGLRKAGDHPGRRALPHSHLPLRRTLVKLGIPRATFCRWYDLYRTGGPNALGDRSPRPDRAWNQIPDMVRQRIIRLALDEPALSPRELAVRFTDTERYFVLEASVYRLLKAHDLIASPAFIVMKAAARLLSDNGSSYISADLAKWLDGQNMGHLRGAPYHPMTQGKIERWHQTLKNRILLENYYLPGDLEAQIAAFVADYNHLRYHESIANLTPADVYFGRGQTILIERERIKRQTIANRRLPHRRQAA